MVHDDKEPSETHNSETHGADEVGGPIEEVKPSYSNKNNKNNNGSSKKGWTLGIIALLIAIILAVSLGITLPKKNDSSSDDDGSTIVTWTPIAEASIAQPEHQIFQDFDANGNMLVVVDVGTPDYSGLIEDNKISLDQAPSYKTHLRLYTQQGGEDGTTTWTLSDTLELEDAHPLTGPEVHIAKDAPIVVLADAEGSDKGTSHGSVRFYNVAGGTFELRAQISDKDDWGSSLDISGDGTRVAIARSLAEHPEGAVQVHEVVMTEAGISGVSQLGSPLFEDKTLEESLASFGAHLGGVALSGSGSVLAVGVPLHSKYDVQAGLIRVWSLNEDTEDWELYTIDIAGDPGQGLGKDVVLSADGNTMATTTMLTDEVLVYTYDKDAASWDLVAQLSGVEVLMTSDGKRIATLTEGVAEVYDWKDDAWVMAGETFEAAEVRLIDDGRIVVYKATGSIETLELN